MGVSCVAVLVAMEVIQALSAEITTDTFPGERVTMGGGVCTCDFTFLAEHAIVSAASSVNCHRGCKGWSRQVLLTSQTSGRTYTFRLKVRRGKARLVRPRLQPPPLTALDLGLQWQFVTVSLLSGESYQGQVIGVYNEAKFMWHPTNYSTIAVFVCKDKTVPLEDFSVHPGSDSAIFTLSSGDISSILVLRHSPTWQDYREYMRGQGHVLEVPPVEGEIYILTGWDSYHTWEDGRGNYAWDIAALTPYMMTYSFPGEQNSDFAVWGRQVSLPMAGTVVTATTNMTDNPPDLEAATQLLDPEDGEPGVEEKPQNMIELRVGGERSAFLLRMIHMEQDSIPEEIQVGQFYPVGTPAGRVGNSGTTLVPHCHVTWGFTNSQGRFWSLPIQWSQVQHRILMPFPTGYQFGRNHTHCAVYPQTGWLVSPLQEEAAPSASIF